MSVNIWERSVNDLAGRCNVTNPKALRKCKELMGLLNCKQLTCPESCKIVICLELASNLTSFGFNREEAVKYSGCKKKIYVNLYNNISKLLNLDKIYSVKEVCLIVGVSDIYNDATKLLEKYQSGNDGIDSEHPMYPCAAVLAVCRTNKIKLNLSKIIEISRIKKRELEDLSLEFQELLGNTRKTLKAGTKRDNSVLVSPDDPIDTEDKPPVRKKANAREQISDDQYNEWKRRMLED